MLYDTCYTMYDRYYLFYVLNPKIISKGRQKLSFLTPKSVRFRSQNGLFSIPKGGSKRESLDPENVLPAAARSNIYESVLAMNGKRRTCRTCR